MKLSCVSLLVIGFAILTLVSCYGPSIPQGTQKRGGVKYDVSTQEPTGLGKAFGCKVRTTYEEIKSPWQQLRDKLAWVAPWLIIGGVLLVAAAVGVHIAVQNPLVHDICSAVGTGGILAALAGLVLAALATWLTLVGIVVVVGIVLYIIHRYRQLSVVGAVKSRLNKARNGVQPTPSANAGTDTAPPPNAGNGP